MHMPEKTIRHFEGLTPDTSVKGVLLDLDNTFYRYAPCHEAALRAAKQEFATLGMALPDFETAYTDARNTVHARLHGQAGSHSRLLYFYTMLADIESGRAIDASLRLERAYWDAFMPQMALVPGISNFLAECRKSGTKVGIVSDLTTRIQFEKIAFLGVAPLIDFILTSEEAGAEKPSEKIFALALERIGQKAEDVIMIGDDLERDIKGASDMGIRSIQIVHG